MRLSEMKSRLPKEKNLSLGELECEPELPYGSDGKLKAPEAGPSVRNDVCDTF